MLVPSHGIEFFSHANCFYFIHLIYFIYFIPFVYFVYFISFIYFSRFICFIYFFRIFVEFHEFKGFCWIDRAPNRGGASSSVISVSKYATAKYFCSLRCARCTLATSPHRDRDERATKSSTRQRRQPREVVFGSLSGMTTDPGIIIVINADGKPR